tara:strand:+ start:249 stop:527 length:279 start_codon:yes stop_codon:yes gene_type:complete
MALTDAIDRQKRKPGNDRDTMRAKADRVLMADLSANDIRIIQKAKKSGYTDAEELNFVLGHAFNRKKPPTIEEIEGALKGTITEPTGKFKKD